MPRSIPFLSHNRVPLVLNTLGDIANRFTVIQQHRE